MKNKIVCLFLFLVVLISGVVLVTYSRKETLQNTLDEEENTYFAIYVDDVVNDSIPPKDSGYTLDTEKSSCNNGVTISWNRDYWTVFLDLTGYVGEGSLRTKCTLYFEKRNIQDEIIAELDTTGACPTVNDDGTVNVTSEESTNSYVCSAPDDYGTSYYFRGDVTNNYVKFAGFYWRILRINGDGSIRMIYTGDVSEIDEYCEGDEPDCDSKIKQILRNGSEFSEMYWTIGESEYNSSDDDNAYVGYMYGTVGASTYEETHANIHDSTVKTYVDSWYESNIKGTKYEAYLSDTLFCNDRSFASDNTGTGTGTSETYYRWALEVTVNYPTLTCKQQNDRFTVNDTTLGNGALTYPVGLINEDEAVLAGQVIDSFSGFVRMEYGDQVSMTPAVYADVAEIVRVAEDSVYLANFSVVYGGEVRPVLSLKADSLKSGSGTWDDPYTL